MLKWPSAAIREPNTATPTTLPTWRIALSVPEATPDRDRSMLPMRVLVICGTSSPIPPPSSTCCPTIWANGVPGPANSRPAHPAAMAASPVRITGRIPIRAASRPVVRLATKTAAVIGKNARPARSAE